MRPRRSTAVLAGATVASIGFLVAMVLSGGRRESGQLVAPSTAGLMAEAPEVVDRVELEWGPRRLVLVRVDGRWRERERDVPRAVVERLQMSVRFMHVAEPVRTLAAGEWEPARASEFGLDPPRYSVALAHGERPLLTASFGAPNPQQVLQYARVEGRDVLYLMPRFVGREWEAVMDSAGR